MPEGGVYDLKMRHSSSRRPLELKSSGNGSIGIDLTSKKDFMKKYLFFFENELIKVENSWLFSDFAQILLVFGCELHPDVGSVTKYQPNPVESSHCNLLREPETFWPKLTSRFLGEYLIFFLQFFFMMKVWIYSPRLARFRHFPRCFENDVIIPT